MKILYLDYNGVLHDAKVMHNRKRGLYMATPTSTFFEWTPILQTLLEPWPDVKIVLSTSWVRSIGFDATKYELPADLRERVIGSTFHHPGLLQSDFDAMPRGVQVAGDVARRKPEAWFALDDDDFGWPVGSRDRLVKTDGRLGLSDTAVQDAVRAMLASMG